MPDLQPYSLLGIYPTRLDLGGSEMLIHKKTSTPSERSVCHVNFAGRARLQVEKQTVTPTSNKDLCCAVAPSYHWWCYWPCTVLPQEPASDLPYQHLRGLGLGRTTCLLTITQGIPGVKRGYRPLCVSCGAYLQQVVGNKRAQQKHVQNSLKLIH